jgi:hypothetical protein
LIEQHNPTWEDLAARLPHHYQSLQHQNQIPPRSPNSGDHVRDDNPHGSLRDKTHVSSRDKTQMSSRGKTHVSFRTK